MNNKWGGEGKKVDLYWEPLSDQPDPSGQPVATLVIRKKQELR